MKEKVAEVLAKRVKDGDVIGIGSGSTVELTLKKIGERIRNEGLQVSGAVSSYHAAMTALEAGIKVLGSTPMPKMSWGFDGADEVDTNLNMIKGHGAAMLNEKIMARSVGHLVIVVTEDKLVSHLGEKFSVPVEVIPAALSIVKAALNEFGVKECIVRRTVDRGIPLITEHGNLILDCSFSSIAPELENRLKCITGVVETGLFMGYAHEVIVAKKSGVVCLTLKNGKVSEQQL